MYVRGPLPQTSPKNIIKVRSIEYRVPAITCTVDLHARTRVWRALPQLGFTMYLCNINNGTY